MKTDVSGLCEFGRDFGLSPLTFDVFFDVFSRRFLLPDVLRPDFCFRTRSAVRFVSFGHCVGYRRHRTRCLSKKRFLKTVSSRLRCGGFYFGVNWDFGFYLSASGECLKIKALVLGRHSIVYSELLFAEFYFGEF